MTIQLGHDLAGRQVAHGISSTTMLALNLDIDSGGDRRPHDLMADKRMGGRARAPAYCPRPNRCRALRQSAESVAVAGGWQRMLPLTTVSSDQSAGPVGALSWPSVAAAARCSDSPSTWPRTAQRAKSALVGEASNLQTSSRRRILCASPSLTVCRGSPDRAPGRAAWRTVKSVECDFSAKQLPR